MDEKNDKFEGATIDREASFIQFVYAFRFEPNHFEDHVKRFESAKWQDRKDTDRPIWEEGKFPSEDLLAHVANYLNPFDDDRTPEKHLSEATAMIWTLSNDAIQSLDGLGSKANWLLNVDSKKIEISFDFREFQLMLFRVGVGFITVNTNPGSDQVSDWLNFIHHFRFAWGRRDVRIQGRKDQTEFFPGLFDRKENKSDNLHTFGELINALLETGAISDKKDNWWKEVFVPKQLLPYGVLFVDKLDQNDIPHFIYMVQNFFHYKQKIDPAPNDLLLDERSTLLPYARKQWFVYSLEGGAFVAISAPETEFFRKGLPAHLRRQYFLLFLLSLHQRFALISISDDVANNWLKKGGLRREKAFNNIRDRMLAFTARGYFTQVMQREHHHRCYCKWQDIFQIKGLYEEVSNEVRDLHEYLQTRQRRRLEMIGFFAAPPLFALTYLQATGQGTPWMAALASISAFIVGALGFFIIRHFDQ